jgi:hypothetical protein
MRRILLLVLASATFFWGCQLSDGARTRLSLLSLNGQGDHAVQPLYSDLVNLGEDGVPSSDDYIVEDAVPFTLRADPVNPTLSLDPQGPFGKIVVTRYRVVFRGDEVLDPVEGQLYLEVPVGETVSGVVTVVPAQMKTKEPLVSYLTAQAELLMTAEITFYGIEETSEEEVSVTGWLPVHFADWADAP